MQTKREWVKQLMVPLRRENRGIKNDPQFSPYMPSHKFVVFHDYGHPTHLGAFTSRTKREAETWIQQHTTAET
jgi:hypothetical protein